MKKFIQKSICVILVFALMNLQGFANVGVFSEIDFSMNDSEIVDFNEDAFYEEFSELSSLEEFLETNETSYSELVAIESSLIASVAPEPLLPFSDDVDSEGPALGIPSFLWGCVLGWVGLLIVYLVTENTDETKKALWGCIASSVIGVVIYVVIIAAAATTTSTSSGYYY